MMESRYQGWDEMSVWRRLSIMFMTCAFASGTSSILFMRDPGSSISIDCPENTVAYCACERACPICYYATTTIEGMMMRPQGDVKRVRVIHPLEDVGLEQVAFYSRLVFVVTFLLFVVCLVVDNRQRVHTHNLREPLLKQEEEPLKDESPESGVA